MNTTCHQKKNENKNTGKREAEEEKQKQVIDFSETECIPSLIVQAAVW